MININIRRYDGDVLSGNARREVVAREQMRCIDECYPVVITVPQGGTPVPKQTDDTQYPAEPELLAHCRVESTRTPADVLF